MPRLVYVEDSATCLPAATDEGFAQSRATSAEALDGKVVEWMEKVSDQQYGQ
jgi:hypothetical protein